MNTRLAIAIAAALLLPLGAATPELGIAQGALGELRIALRIPAPGDVGAGLPNYEASIRRASLDSGTPRGIALASIPVRAPPTRDAIRRPGVARSTGRRLTDILGMTHTRFRAAQRPL